jgi:hypothetical protein
MQQGIGMLGLYVQTCLQDGWGAGAAISIRQPCLTHRAQAQLSPCSEHPDGNLATVGCHDLVEWHLSGVESLQAASSRSGLAPAADLLSVGCCFCIGSHLETIVVGHTSDNIPADAFLYFQGLNARLLGQGRWYYRRAGTMLLWWATLWPAGLLAHVQHIARNNTTPRGRDLLHLHAASSA